MSQNYLLRWGVLWGKKNPKSEIYSFASFEKDGKSQLKFPRTSVRVVVRVTEGDGGGVDF